MGKFGTAVVVMLASLALAAPAAAEEEVVPVKPSALEGSSIPWCYEVQPVEPDPDLFADTPVYIANEQPTAKVQRWAKKQPGFADLWIDRDHLGWLVVAFTQDVEQRQAEIEQLFPDDGVVAVKVEHTTKQLRKLQNRLSKRLRKSLSWMGIDVTANLVEVGVQFVTPRIVKRLEQEFAGEPFCLSGRDPSERPKPGPQPTEGDGWELVGHKQGKGPSYRTGAATDADQLAQLWRTSRVKGKVPSVDFDEAIVVWFAIGHGSTCTNLRMDDVVVDTEAAVIYPDMVDVDANAGCTDDLVGTFQYVVAIDRERLPGAPFVVMTGPPHGGVSYDQTVVEADLREPGAVAETDQIHRARQRNEEPVLRSGTFVEPFGSWQYAFDASCGIGYLGEINDVHWITDGSEVPAAWAPSLGDDGELIVEIEVRARPEPHVDATANGLTVRYLPVAQAPAACGA